MVWPAVIAAASVAMNYLGSKSAAKAAAGAASNAANERERASAVMANLKVPSINEQKIDLLNSDLLYNYTPEEERAIEMEKTAYEDIADAPRLRLAQMNAIQDLENRSRNGLTSEDVADINNARRTLASQASARDSSIVQDMEQRGMGGSGLELAARLNAGQRTAQTAAEEADRMAALRQQTMQQAVVQAGQSASNLRNQDYNEASGLASNQDAVTKFNKLQLANAQQRNIAERNVANKTKEGMRQTLEGQRVATKNQQEIANKGLIQTNYRDRFDKAKVQSGIYDKSASAIEEAGKNKAKNKSDMFGGIADIASSAISAYGNKT